MVDVVQLPLCASIIDTQRRHVQHLIDHMLDVITPHVITPHVIGPHVIPRIIGPHIDKSILAIQLDAMPLQLGEENGDEE